MVIKTATYSGMNLRGDVRESVSLDEDDLSDVEDEVFIRDGKNGYKLAEELNVKRPLMAPRRRACRQDAGTRLKPKPTCRAFCKPCCYVFAALSVLIGLIVLVVILVSIYPLPLDKLRDWMISRSKTNKNPNKLLPCTSLKVTDVWSVNLPTLTTESPVRTLDINGDGIDDILFGFGTGENYNIFPPDIFCPIFLGVSPPCEGGIIALNGVNGEILWRHWLNDTIFSLHCSADLNEDGLNDCLGIGVDGTIAVIDTKDGQTIWQLNTGKMNVFVANLISDQNGDNISDVIASHSNLEDKNGGHIIVFSGKTGQELKRINIQNEAKTFYMPQILKQNESSTLILFGTGTPNKPGNLSVVPLMELNSESLVNKSQVVFEDKFKGMLTQSVLVDITGDAIPDIISSMYNSTVVAINGRTFEQIWNYSISNAVTDMSPTPAYFNYDNITDFLVIYQKYDKIFNYNYTQTLIIDGFTGQPIYNPISGGVITQMNALTLSMESYGHDIFLFWTNECWSIDFPKNVDNAQNKTEIFKLYDECKKQFNSSSILKLNALNEFHQPPGITVYNSAEKESLEYNNSKSVTKRLKEYLKNHPNPFIPSSNIKSRGQSEVLKTYSGDPVPIGIRKYGKSNFRHKDRPSDIVKGFDDNPDSSNININNQPIDLTDQVPRIPDQPVDYNMWLSNQEELDPEFNNYNLADDGSNPYNQKQIIFDDAIPPAPATNRDPRSKDKKINIAKTDNKQPPKMSTKSKKKNLSDKIYGYHNVRLAKNRLLHDDENLPTDILKDTYFKNEENRLKKSKFEQRDVNSHVERERDDKAVKQLMEEQKSAVLNGSMTLWDLESEKEIRERDNGFYKRDKRNAGDGFESISKITSVGAVLGSFNTSNSFNSIDVVFVKYWQPFDSTLDSMLKNDIEECITDKILKTPPDQKTTENEQKSLFQTECQEEQDNLRRDFTYFNQLGRLRLGQMTVYRIRIQCECDSTYDNNIKDRCVRFLHKDLQSWSSYLGKNGDGVFKNKM